MKTSPAISVNGGSLNDEFIAKVMSVLPEEFDLFDMLMRLKYLPEAELPDDEALQEANYDPGNAISEKLREIMKDLEKGNNFDGNLVDYFALKRHDPEAHALLTHAAEKVEEISHLLDEFNWLISSDGQTQHQIWEMEHSAPKLIPTNPDSFS